MPSQHDIYLTLPGAANFQDGIGPMHFDLFRHSLDYAEVGNRRVLGAAGRVQLGGDVAPLVAAVGPSRTLVPLSDWQFLLRER